MSLLNLWRHRSCTAVSRFSASKRAYRAGAKEKFDSLKRQKNEKIKAENEAARRKARFNLKNEYRLYTMADAKKVHTLKGLYGTFVQMRLNDLAFVMARLKLNEEKNQLVGRRMNSFTYRQSVVLIFGILGFLYFTICITFYEGNEKQKLLRKIRAQKFADFERLANAGFDLPDDEVILIAMDGILLGVSTYGAEGSLFAPFRLMDGGTDRVEGYEQMTKLATQAFQYMHLELQGLSPAMLYRKSEQVKFIEYFRQYPLTTKFIMKELRNGVSDKAEVVLRLLETRESHTETMRNELTKLLSQSPGLCHYAVNPDLSVQEASRIVYQNRKEAGSKLAIKIFKVLLEREIERLKS